jgi:hypothetical protein
MILFPGCAVTDSHVRLWKETHRSMKFWGIGIGWFFLGFVTFPKDKP